MICVHDIAPKCLFKFHDPLLPLCKSSGAKAQLEWDAVDSQDDGWTKAASIGQIHISPNIQVDH